MINVKVVVTGSSKGIGKAVAEWFCGNGHEVHGIDILPSNIHNADNYIHYTCDVRDSYNLPSLSDVNVLINNAGVQNSGDDIGVNLKGVINCTEKYGIQESIQSIINMASVSAHNGAEFPEYCASKGGVLAYTVNTAKRIAKFGATCNSISFGGVLTGLNDTVIKDEYKWQQIMRMTPLKKWITLDECANWVYFLAMSNHSMSGQDLIIDNLETYNHTFVW